MKSISERYNHRTNETNGDLTDAIVWLFSFTENDCQPDDLNAWAAERKYIVLHVKLIIV
jgi:hypothetical protein